MNESTDHVIPNKVQNTYIIVQKLQEAREIAKIGKTKTVTKAVSPVTPVTEKAPNSKPRKTTLEKFSHLGKFDLGLTQSNKDIVPTNKVDSVDSGNNSVIAIKQKAPIRKSRRSTLLSFFA